MELHPGWRAVTKAGTEVRLSPIEFALLELLARHVGEVVDRARLLEHGWSYDYANSSNVVEVYLGRLREKVDRPFGTHTIETVRGKGYRLVGRDYMALSIGSSCVRGSVRAMKVLIVEDELKMAGLIRRGLRDDGMPPTSR